MSIRPTRLRKNKMIRSLVKENRISMDEIIYPVFIVEGNNIKEEISSMKDQYHFSIDRLLEEVVELRKLGINNLLLFGNLEHKSIKGSSGYEESGLVQRAIKALKDKYEDLFVIADVCLCQCKEDGHCCIYDKQGNIERVETLETLSKVALSYAKAGVDMVAPSDMMDGRVGYIREVLDKNGFEHVPIMAYSAKYASSFYGPFREAAHSAPAYGDRKSYQMDPANGKEAKREVLLDVEEGADIIMIKPAMPYLDVIRDTKNIISNPIAAYQVSGEYAMLVSAVENGILDKRAIYESLISIKRSGADIIITYFAKEIKSIIEGEN